jgi:hypothetical protein
MTYSEGDTVLAENNALLQTVINESSSVQEKELFGLAKDYRAKLEILHFETGDTQVFDVVKMPELRFAKEKSSGGGRFHFDPRSYNNCRNDGAGANLDRQDASADSVLLERLDPNTLSLVLEVLRKQTGGIAIDPMSGVVM